MKNNFLSAFAALLICGYLTSAAIAQPNILANGDFEADPEGTTVNVSGGGEVNTITGWRYFAVGGATASATVTSAAGRSGKGLEIVRQAANGSDSALDKDDNSIRETIPAEVRVYKLTVDARDGGAFGGSSRLFAQMQFPGTSSPTREYDPSADWETFGLTARSGTGGQLSTRLNMRSEENASLYLDNATVVDATFGVNRIVNGGFENSNSRTLNWRFFGGSGSASLSSNANTGDSAVLLTRTATDGDLGLDLDNQRIAAIGGETITLSFAAMTADTTNPSSSLQYTIAAFNAGGGWEGDILTGTVAPSSAAYDTYSFDVAMPQNATQFNVAFRPAGGVGSFLIDDVSVMAIPEPATVSLVLLSLTVMFGRRRGS